MKITIISSNLSLNGTARCMSIAEVLRGKYEVEIVGTTFGIGANFGEGLWPPAANSSIPIRSVRGDYWPGYIKSVIKLLKLMDGDIVIAHKPRMASLGIALLKRLLTGKPVILDVDDDELAQTLPGKNARLTSFLGNPNAYLGTRIIHPFHRFANAVTCVSEFFQNRYGGDILPHCRDPKLLDPKDFDGSDVRKELGIPAGQKIVGFIGAPQTAKGVDLLAEAIAGIRGHDVRLMLVGATAEDPLVKQLVFQYGDLIVLAGQQPFEKVPFYLAASDIIALPQRNVPISYGQMPLKLTDAMAMAKPIIASRISDIPKYLENCGLIVEPDDLSDLANKLQWAFDNFETTRSLGKKAHDVFLEQLSTDAGLKILEPILHKLQNR